MQYPHFELFRLVFLKQKGKYMIGQSTHGKKYHVLNNGEYNLRVGHDLSFHAQRLRKGWFGRVVLVPIEHEKYMSLLKERDALPAIQGIDTTAKD